MRYSDRILSTPSSFIRDILKVTQDPSVISFAGGLPNPISFPEEALKESACRIIDNEGGKVFQYSTTEGHLPLRQFVADKYNKNFGLNITPEDVLITTGSQQALDLIAKTLLNKGDRVIIEEPGYLGAIQAFCMFEPEFLPVTLEDDGLDLKKLEEALKKERVKFAYVVPNFQNPTGLTYSKERREAVCALFDRYDTVLVEDDPYGELRFEGEYMPALKSLDTKGLVIYLGTFSKILAPGYRLGWVCAEDEILAKYNFMEQAASLQASTIGQMETSKWIDMFDLDAHVNTIRECYRKRRAVMLETLAKELPEPCTFTRPDGGLFAWVVLPEYMDAKDLQMKCLAKKVAFVPGGSFFPNGGHDNTLRLNYSCMPEDKIVKGITALCQTIRENLR